MQDEAHALLKAIFEERIPFNKLLGLSVGALGAQDIAVSFNLEQSLIGNPSKKILHGGVIASVIDAAGGVAVGRNLIDRMGDSSLKELGVKLTKMGTIDMRVDYLRPGVGEKFVCTAYPLRFGRKVAVVRTEFHNENRDLIAAGVASYIVS